MIYIWPYQAIINTDILMISYLSCIDDLSCIDGNNKAHYVSTDKVILSLAFKATAVPTSRSLTLSAPSYLFRISPNLEVLGPYSRINFAIS